jgi:hypothetical protein
MTSNVPSTELWCLPNEAAVVESVENYQGLWAKTISKKETTRQQLSNKGGRGGVGRELPSGTMGEDDQQERSDKTAIEQQNNVIIKKYIHMYINRAFFMLLV